MKKGDKIVAIGVLGLLVVSSLAVRLYKYFNQGKTLNAKIIQNQKVIEAIDLNSVEEPREWRIEEENGKFNIIRVEKGKIRFIDANCPDLVCVHSGWLSEPGDIAVCLPHKLSIHIEGINEELDQVTY
ncbi:MAG: NusG domain II-containing protein [Epulopiscium sp.]|nr:NusG domain II-containing protein [Candidatus Epulonipiscium sp.]